MKLHARRRRLEQSPRSWIPVARGPFGSVTIYATTAETLLRHDDGPL